MSTLEQLENARDAVTRVSHPNRGPMLLILERVMKCVGMNNANRERYRFSKDDLERQGQAFAEQQVGLMVERTLSAARRTIALDGR